MPATLLEESRQSATASWDPIQLAKVGHVKLFDNEDMFFNTVQSVTVNIIGCNSLMLVFTLSAQSDLLALGFEHDPHGLARLPASNPHAINSVVTAGADVVVFSWGAYTTLGGGPNQDTTMKVWEYMDLEVSETNGFETFMTVDLFVGKR
jgi:hypothetical protein